MAVGSVILFSVAQKSFQHREKPIKKHENTISSPFNSRNPLLFTSQGFYRIPAL